MLELLLEFLVGILQSSLLVCPPKGGGADVRPKADELSKDVAGQPAISLSSVRFCHPHRTWSLFGVLLSGMANCSFGKKNLKLKTSTLLGTEA